MPLSRFRTTTPQSRLRRSLFALVAALVGWRGARTKNDPSIAIRNGWILRGDDR